MVDFTVALYLNKEKRPARHLFYFVVVEGCFFIYTGVMIANMILSIQAQNIHLF